MDLGQLPTEGNNPRTRDLDRLSAIEIVRRINEEDQTIALSVAKTLPQIAQAADLVAEALATGHRLFYTGAGTSGRLGVLDASECPPTFGTDPALVQGIIAGGFDALIRSGEGVEDNRLAGAQDLVARGVAAGDIVVGLAASGRTPYALAALQQARELGARTVAITCNPGSVVGQAAEIAIEVLVGPEVLTGSTRMKAGTAQKLVLNMLSTAAMVRLGKVYGNLMVDLQPSNEKLVERARRIIMTATDCQYERAAAALDQASRHVKTAIVMVKANLDAAAARDLLTQNRGFIRKALESVGVNN
ncbi:MAG: N-acetylmuramic acid 6-phosphate etherase [Symbiobacteriia bacterium]